MIDEKAFKKSVEVYAKENELGRNTCNPKALKKAFESYEAAKASEQPVDCAKCGRTVASSWKCDCRLGKCADCEANGPYCTCDLQKAEWPDEWVVEAIKRIAAIKPGPRSGLVGVARALGEATGIAQGVIEALAVERRTPKRESVSPNAEALTKFKEYVHKRLDDAGIPTHPEGEHSKHGCRIGDRLDIALKAPIAVTNALKEAAFHYPPTEDLPAFEGGETSGEYMDALHKRIMGGEWSTRPADLLTRIDQLLEREMQNNYRKAIARNALSQIEDGVGDDKA